MELGIVGLGRMGLGMADRLIGGGHRVVGYDQRPGPVEALSRKGGNGVDSERDLAGGLSPPRAVWLMVPAGNAVDEAIGRLAPLLDAGDILVDGGNSYYKDSIRRSGRMGERGIRYLDVGTSGGIRGPEEGYSMMIGGDPVAVERLRPVFEALAPAPDRGWGHVGPSGAGHFAKMVHNGIEYGLMEAYAEGFSMLRHKTEMNLDAGKIAEIWRHGSVIRSWLLDLTAEVLAENPRLEGIEPYVEDSGEGRWAVAEAIEIDVPTPVITASLIARLRSRDGEGFSERLLAAMRNRFGGHRIRTQL